MNNGNKNMSNENAFFVNSQGSSSVHCNWNNIFRHCIFTNVAMPTTVFHLSGTTKQDFTDEIYIVFILQRLRYFDENNQPICSCKY